MTLNKSQLIDLFASSDSFRHIKEINNTIYLFNDVADMTAFCVPSAKRIMGFIRIDYGLGLAVPFERYDYLRGIVRSLSSRRYVILPTVISPENSMDMLVAEGKLSEWLVNNIITDMQRHTLDCQSALNVIEQGQDRFIIDLNSVYKERFIEYIVGPLTKFSLQG